MFIRSVFVILRLLGYGAIFFTLNYDAVGRPWWQWLVGVVAWIYGAMEHWKRPNEPTRKMRWGTWVETGIILTWSLALHNTLPLLLLISPIARTGVHLGWRDSVLLFACYAVCWSEISQFSSPADWLPAAEWGIFLTVSIYSLVLGELLRQRDRLRQTVELTAWERELRVKDEERIRLAGHLHDSMGQYWTAVIRALDVAGQVPGEQRQVFIGKARMAAMEGLAAMRKSVHAWNKGTQAPKEWLDYAQTALLRLRDAVGLDVQLDLSAIAWFRFAERLYVAELLARTMIEGGTNAVRHGRAQMLRVVLQTDDTGVLLHVHDDGRGSGDSESNPHAGMGIDSLRRQAEAVGGTFAVIPGAANGMTITLKIPYTWQEQSRSEGYGDSSRDS